MQSAEMLVGDHFERMRFRLPRSEKWLEVSGKLVWLGKTGKEAGIQFVDLDNDVMQQIRSWVHSAARRPGLPVEQGQFKVVWEVEERDAAGGQPSGESEPAEFDPMFPSEKSPSSETHPGLNKTFSLDSAPARDRVKHSKPDAAASSPLQPYELPLVRPVARAEKHTEQTEPPEERIEQSIEELLGEAERVAKQTRARPGDRSGPDIRSLRAAFANSGPAGSATRAPAKHPFASIVADEARTTDSRAPAFSSNPMRPEESAFPPDPIDFGGLGYQPTAFEEPSGRGWLIAGAILVALLGFGTALAIGPANVQALFSKYLFSHLPSAEGPPPPANISEKTPADTSASNVPSATSSPTPLDSSSQQPVLNPGVEPETGSERQPPASPGASGIVKERSDSARPGGASNATSGSADLEINRSDLEETPEIAEAKTRQFQMEHSLGSSARAVAPALTDSSASRQAPPVAPSAMKNDRTMDAYADPAPARPNWSGTAALPAGGAPRSQAPAIPAGTVAISSHFHSIRGEESLEAPPDRAVQIGQLTLIHQPQYSAEAERAHVEGTVLLRATVDQVGRVEIVHVLSGPPMLVPAAVEAVREWRYAPTILDGRAVEGVNDVTVLFRLSNATSSPQ